MQQSGTTPVPNVLFDSCLKELKCAELKVLLVIIRQTLGWADKQSALGRKEMDWISGSQLKVKTGSSSRAISAAIEVLIKKALIEVLDGHGNLLHDPTIRKGRQRLYFRPASVLITPVDNVGISSAYPLHSEKASAKIAEGFSKKITGLAQKMHITKETLQK